MRQNPQNCVLWRGVSAPPAAYAQVPDSGAQRNELIKQQRVTNQKLAQIVQLLTEIRDRQDVEAAQADERPQKRRP